MPWWGMWSVLVITGDSLRSSLEKLWSSFISLSILAHDRDLNLSCKFELLGKTARKAGSGLLGSVLKVFQSSSCRFGQTPR